MLCHMADDVTEDTPPCAFNLLAPLIIVLGSRFYHRRQPMIVVVGFNVEVMTVMSYGTLLDFL